MIRLLKLQSGAIDTPDIICSLFEATYDPEFHIPMFGSIPEDESPEGQASKKAETAKENPEQTLGEAPEKPPEERGQEETKKSLAKYYNVEKLQIEYEALSWCWGAGDNNYALRIVDNERQTSYKMRVREDLALALKHLRRSDTDRILWIDMLCIDQNNPSERSHQVQMMSRIHTRAKQVCIWLGDGDKSSELAIDFVDNKIMDLRNFDSLSDDGQYADHWKALMELMSRQWFSRRWVIQEIALARKAVIYCGKDSIPWRKFAVAVELFVEVENATHRLSEMMRRDEKFRHVPGWFEYVAELGASVLVQATGKVFRAQSSPLDDDDEPAKSETAAHGSKTKAQPSGKHLQISKLKGHEVAERLAKFQTIDPLDRRSLLSLEYLVSSMSMFMASEPRDSIYAMLAIARDAAPFAGSEEDIVDPYDRKPRLLMTACEPFLEEKPFPVDYSRPYADVCKDFIEFAVKRKEKLDPAQALDILCRPWALDPRAKKSKRHGTATLKVTREPKQVDRSKKDQWKKRVRDSLGHYLDAEKQDPRSLDEYWNECQNMHFKSGTESEKDRVPEKWKKKIKIHLESDDGETETKTESSTPNPTSNGTVKIPRVTHREENLLLPSWVSRMSHGPMILDFSPGIEDKKTGRANADPLVGPSVDGHRNYSAAKSLRMRPIKFRRRPHVQDESLHGHYSLYVQGFELDEVDQVLDASQGGNIPKSWLELGGWDDFQRDPPQELWRTLVADRGQDNRNPPYYYATACKESVAKGGIGSGRVDTVALINNERNSIVAEFCRRVHAVIWNRRLFKTEGGRLGLARDVKKGDRVCILYGCTVPVILTKQANKEDIDCKEEMNEDLFEFAKRAVRKCERLYDRRLNWKKTKAALQGEEKQKWEKAWKDAKDVMEKLEKERKAAPKDPRESSSEEYALPPWERYGIEDRMIWLEPPAPPKKYQSRQNKHDADMQDIGDQDDTGQSESTNDDSTEASSEREETQREKERLKREKEARVKNETKEWFQFKGECYLHGMMDGEAVRAKLYQQHAHDRVFELR